jgi:hypothetical protein
MFTTSSRIAKHMNSHAAPSVAVKYGGVKDQILSLRISKQQYPAPLQAVHHFYSNKADTLRHSYLPGVDKVA